MRPGKGKTHDARRHGHGIFAEGETKAARSASERTEGPGQNKARQKESLPGFLQEKHGGSADAGRHLRLKTLRTVSTACMVYSGLAASWKRSFMKDMGS